MARLAMAGIIGTTVHNAATGEGAVRFTPEFLRLLMAGRDVLSEPGFKNAWRTGDPAVVRRWIAAEAALLADQADESTASDTP